MAFSFHLSFVLSFYLYVLQSFSAFLISSSFLISFHMNSSSLPFILSLSYLPSPSFFQFSFLLIPLSFLDSFILSIFSFFPSFFRPFYYSFWLLLLPWGPTGLLESRHLVIKVKVTNLHL